MRMPFYFILSGLFFKDYGGIFNLMEKKLNKLIVPFLFFFLIGLLVAWFKMRSLDFSLLIDPMDNWAMRANSPVWFLICLFWTNVIFCIVCMMVKSLYIRGVVVLCIGAIGYILNVYQIFTPLFFGSALTALPFFFTGYLIKRFPLLYPNKFDRYNILLAIALIGTGILYSLYRVHPYIHFVKNDYKGNPVEIYFLGICLVLGVLILCKSIRWLPIISYMGRYSIIILGLHGIIVFTLGIGQSSFSDLQAFFITIIPCWLAIPFLIKFFPKFTAQKDLIRLPRRTNSSEKEVVEVEKN